MVHTLYFLLFFFFGKHKVSKYAAGEINENVILYEGNSIAIVVGASRYKIITERAKIIHVNIPVLNLLVLKQSKKGGAGGGYIKKRYRKPTIDELEKQQVNTTYDVMYDLDGFLEKKVPRTRIIAF